MQKNSLNKVFIIGFLGANPEGRYTSNGRAFVSFSVATNETWKQQDGKVINHTEWHHIVAWDKLADFVKEHLERGQLVSIEGSLRSRSWTNKEDATVKISEIVASQIIPLGTKKEA